MHYILNEKKLPSVWTSPSEKFQQQQFHRVALKLLQRYCTLGSSEPGEAATTKHRLWEKILGYRNEHYYPQETQMCATFRFLLNTLMEVDEILIVNKQSFSEILIVQIKSVWHHLPPHWQNSSVWQQAYLNLGHEHSLSNRVVHIELLKMAR